MEYTVKCKFLTAKAGRGARSIIGGSHNAEVDIAVDNPIDIEKEKGHPDLIMSMKEFLRTNPKMPKGAIINFEITDIVEKQSNR